MSIGWPKANGRFVMGTSGCAGRVRALFALPCASQLANSWAAGIEETCSGSRSFLVSSKRRFLGLDFGRESSLCRARRRKAHEATRDSQALRTEHRRTGGAPEHLD